MGETIIVKEEIKVEVSDDEGEKSNVQVKREIPSPETVGEENGPDDVRLIKECMRFPEIHEEVQVDATPLQVDANGDVHMAEPEPLVVHSPCPASLPTLAPTTSKSTTPVLAKSRTPSGNAID